MYSEVSQVLPLRKKMHAKNPGYPAKQLKTPSGFFAAALLANFSIAKFGIIALSLAAALALSGCGYTTSSLVSTEFKTIYVANFKNDIRMTAEQTDLRMYRGYRPGMETEITKAVIDRFMYDGNLKIAFEDKADLILKSELVDYKRDSLRYDANDNVEEYRIKLIVNMSLEDAKNGKVLWTEKGFAGECTYRLFGNGAMTENAAIKVAVSDLATRIVERTVEAW